MARSKASQTPIDEASMTEPDPDHKFPQRVGSRMIVIAWVLGLVLLSWFFSNYLKHQQNPNQQVHSYRQSGATQVVLQRNRDGHYVASGRINGQPVTFFLDTGATMVSIPGHLAGRLSLVKGPVYRVATANGDVPVYSTMLNEVQLGGIKLKHVRASINPSMQGDEVLLGMSFLKQLDFSQEGDQLTLRQASSTD